MRRVLFEPRQAASIVKQHLVETLAKIQQRILLVERFGEFAVPSPMLGRMGTDELPKLLERHKELVEQIIALQGAQDSATEADIAAFIDIARRRNA